MRINRMFTVIFALCIELSVLIYISSLVAGWVSKTWKWDENLVVVGGFAVAFTVWFIHVSKVLENNSPSPTPESQDIPRDPGGNTPH